jgi:hypothetical protein
VGSQTTHCGQPDNPLWAARQPTPTRTGWCGSAAWKTSEWFAQTTDLVYCRAMGLHVHAMGQHVRARIGQAAERSTHLGNVACVDPGDPILDVITRLVHSPEPTGPKWSGTHVSLLGAGKRSAAAGSCRFPRRAYSSGSLRQGTVVKAPAKNVFASPLRQGADRYRRQWSSGSWGKWCGLHKKFACGQNNRPIPTGSKRTRARPTRLGLALTIQNGASGIVTTTTTAANADAATAHPPSHQTLRRG